MVEQKQRLKSFVNKVLFLMLIVSIKILGSDDGN